MGKSHRDHFPQSTRYDGQATLLASGFSLGHRQLVRGTPSLLSKKLDVVFRSFDIQTKGMSSKNFPHSTRDYNIYRRRPYGRQS